MKPVFEEPCDENVGELFSVLLKYVPEDIEARLLRSEGDFHWTNDPSGEIQSLLQPLYNGRFPGRGSKISFYIMNLSGEGNFVWTNYGKGIYYYVACTSLFFDFNDNGKVTNTSVLRSLGRRVSAEQDQEIRKLTNAVLRNCFGVGRRKSKAGMH